MNRAVVEMDQVTQQNAALVEEAAAAAHSLKDQVDVLREAIGKFQVAGLRFHLVARPDEKRA